MVKYFTPCLKASPSPDAKCPTSTGKCSTTSYMSRPLPDRRLQLCPILRDPAPFTGGKQLLPLYPSPEPSPDSLNPLSSHLSGDGSMVFVQELVSDLGLLNRMKFKLTIPAQSLFKTWPCSFLQPHRDVPTVLPWLRHCHLLAGTRSL